MLPVGVAGGLGMPGRGEMRLLEGFRTLPTTVAALVCEPSGTPSQPGGQS